MSARKEEWRDIPGYGDWYQISDWGRVRTWRAGRAEGARLKEPKIIKVNTAQRVATVCLTADDRSRKRVGIMRLMAQVWLGGLPPGKRTIHKDGNIKNNSRWNIAIVSERERLQAASKARVSKMRKAVVVFDETLTAIDAYPSAREAGRKTRLSSTNVIRHCNFDCASVFAMNGLIYTWDDTRSIWAALRRAMRELDTLGIPYNNPFTGRYFDLPPEEEPGLDPTALWWSIAPALAGGGRFGYTLTWKGA